MLNASTIEGIGSPLLGILGGMGPAATADFLAKLVRATDAEVDQDHIPTMTLSVPTIPDRARAILEGGPSPLPLLSHLARRLEAGGARAIAIPCNTAHYWIAEIRAQVGCPIISIVDAVAGAILRGPSDAKVAGLLATTATVRAGIYSDGLRKHGLEWIAPAEDDQISIMELIKQVKRGTANDRSEAELARIAHRMRERGAGAVILGCSELPLLMPARSEWCIDATDALAAECVSRWARMTERQN
jgi:aspartate racemase